MYEYYVRFYKEKRIKKPLFDDKGNPVRAHFYEHVQMYDTFSLEMFNYGIIGEQFYIDDVRRFSQELEKVGKIWKVHSRHHDIIKGKKAVILEVAPT